MLRRDCRRAVERAGSGSTAPAAGSAAAQGTTSFAAEPGSSLLRVSADSVEAVWASVSFSRQTRPVAFRSHAAVVGGGAAERTVGPKVRGTSFARRTLAIQLLRLGEIQP